MEFREDVYLGMKRPISPPLMNGGGCCKTIEDVRILSKSSAGGIVLGSITWDERDGNPGNVWQVIDGDGMNSLGMPNGGRKVLTDDLPEMVTIAHDADKAMIVNVAGFDPEQYAMLSELAFENGADAVELNLGCPNVVASDGSRKPVPSFNPDLIARILLRVLLRVGKGAAIWAKMSHYSDPALLKLVATDFILPNPVVKAVSTTNTTPSVYDVNDNGVSIITVGYAGGSGKLLKRIRMGQVKQFSDALRGEVAVIAVGAIDSGKDIRNSQVAGAVGFQMVTALLKDNFLNPQPIERVMTEYMFDSFDTAA